MDFGSIVVELRKEQGISQTDLASQLGIHKNVLGRYERNEVLPSIEIARKIADILDVSLDYLTGKADVQMDKNTRKRILEVSKFEDTDKEHIFSVIDAFIAKRKIQSILYTKKPPLSRWFLLFLDFIFLVDNIELLYLKILL